MIARKGCRHRGDAYGELLTGALFSHEMIPMEMGVPCLSMKQSPLGSWGWADPLDLYGLCSFQRAGVCNCFLSRLAPATFPLSSSEEEAEYLGRGPGSGVSKQLQGCRVMVALCLPLLSKTVEFPGCPGRGVKC